MGLKVKDLMAELVFQASRSSGPGGQNVNKVNSKVTLKFDVNASKVLSDKQKAVLKEKIASRISSEGVLVISAQNKRSQLQNKEAALKKLERLLKKAFSIQKKRLKTKPTAASKKKRMDDKKRHSQKKEQRKKDW